jgi:hypothetical protein
LGVFVKKWPELSPAKASELVSTFIPPATAVSVSPAQSEVHAVYAKE